MHYVQCLHLTNTIESYHNFYKVQSILAVFSHNNHTYIIFYPKRSEKNILAFRMFSQTYIFMWSNKINVNVVRRIKVFKKQNTLPCWKTNAQFFDILFSLWTFGYSGIFDINFLLMCIRSRCLKYGITNLRTMFLIFTSLTNLF